MRAVFDTNVFIAAALTGDFTEKLFQLATDNHINLLTSAEILSELKQKLLSKFNKSEEEIDFFIARIIRVAEIVEVKEKLDIISRDPEDNKILECAIAGDADIIVTADQDLIKLKEYRGIAILHPKTLAYTFPRHFKKKNRA